jgi:hypothetical protein
LHWFERTPVVVERKSSDGEFTGRAIDRHRIYTYRATPIHGLTPAIARPVEEYLKNVAG